MNLPVRNVIVKDMPQDFGSGQCHAFLRELVQAMSGDIRPAVVLDFSHTLRIDKETLQLLLTCLEVAMKRNGDVRLAGVHRDAWPVLESTGVGRLFQTFATRFEAVDSYRRPALGQSSIGRSAVNEAEANAA